MNTCKIKLDVWLLDYIQSIFQISQENIYMSFIKNVMNS